MDARQRERLQVAHRASRALRRPGFRSSLEVQASDGTRPIFAALPDDLAAWVFEQVHALGGNVNVVVLEEVEPDLHRLAVVAVADVADDVLDLEQVVVHPDAEFGFLVQLLRMHDHPVRCAVLSPDAVAQLVAT